MISPHVWQAWLPPVKQSAVEWIPQNVWMPPGTESDGQYDLDVAPHTRGVLEAWDDPDVREITLCWATRNMKTTTVISLLIFTAATAPCSMAMGSCDEPSIDRVIDEQLYPMLERCEATSPLLPPPHRRGKDSVKLKSCRIRKAYGGSPGSVAGYPAEIVAINEYSKWPRHKSSEADTARGFAQRAKGFPFTSKVIKESSPGEKATCRVWTDLHAKTTDRRMFHVQCPHCREYQVLEFGDKDTAYGIKWERPKSGSSDPLLAEATAYYMCRHCAGHIQNEDRALMMRSGVWLSEGQSISKRGKITGKRKVESSHIGFGPLSSLYSLLISGWGQIVKEFLSCGNDPEKLREFNNSTLALVWDPVPKKLDPDDVISRLCIPTARRVICPDWTVFLTRGSDVQDDASRFKWDVLAWGPKGRSAVIDWGETYGQPAFKGLIQTISYPATDGGTPFTVMGTAIDSGDGDMTEELYRFCRDVPRCMPAKGASSKFEQAYKENPIGDPKFAGLKLLLVNTHRSQRWLEGHLKGLVTNPEIAFTLPLEASVDPFYVQELLNEACVDGIWQKTGDNDHRDAIRYAWAMAMRITRQGSTFDKLIPRNLATQQQESQDSDPRTESIFTSGGGRQWPK